MATTAPLPPRHDPAPPPAVRRGEGCWLEDDAGRPLLDLTAGNATLALGHGHPDVVAAAAAQLGRLVHACAGHDPGRRLAARLAEVTPAGLEAVRFAVSGSEANEMAVAAAQRMTGRPGVVCFRGGFHGRTAGARSCTTADPELGPPRPAGPVAVAPFPRPRAWGADADRAADIALAGLDEVLAHEMPPAAVACMLVEPVQGRGGCHPAGHRFLAGLRERADRIGALLVFDEVQTGLGRTGAWLAAQSLGVRPDLVTMAKALGAGLPLGALVGPAGAVGPAQGSTFAGGPVPCAAGLAAIDAIRRDGVLAHAREMGARAADGLARATAGLPGVREVRGLGLMLGVELAAPDLAARAQAAAREQGVLVSRSGPAGEVLRLTPPLVIGAAELDHGVEVVARSIARAGGAA